MMNRKLQIYRKILIGCTGIIMCILFLFVYMDAANRVPEKINLISGREQTLNLSVPVTGEIGVSNIPRDKIHMNLQQTNVVNSGSENTYRMECRLFGFIPLKTVDVSVIEEQSLIPAGIPIGIYVKTNGVLVIGTGEVQGMDGFTYEPAQYLLQTGDYIEKVNERPVENKTELIDSLNEIGAGEIVFTVRRDAEVFNVKLNSVETAPGEYKLGIWVRDNTQGIGTLTFLKKNGEFGALGHGVNDVDTAGLMDVYGGTLYEAQILSITKGKSGTPGELSGVIDYKKENILGEITVNTPGGIFGVGNEELVKKVSAGEVPVGLKQDIRCGKATILCTIEGKTSEYEIEISKVDYTPQSINKGIVFYVTDEDLLSKTGGIVQGLSGSPILQDGKIVGAVTHVFIQDPTKGFGIFIESMLESSE